MLPFLTTSVVCTVYMPSHNTKWLSSPAVACITFDAALRLNLYCLAQQDGASNGVMFSKHRSKVGGKFSMR